MESLKNKCPIKKKTKQIAGKTEMLVLFSILLLPNVLLLCNGLTDAPPSCFR